jgi:diaminohydroxyphosphoribosylaminopyrimidine deaminase/5-amino-6-(5-phosphoribosylamino)uracil reductase
MSNNEHYMQRCLQLAEMGLGKVGSNPMVGSVVVCDGKIIGEGYHELFGGPHAEVNAIHNVIDQDLLSRSTIYVNLEPCSHTGKTPPCSTFIIEKENSFRRYRDARSVS